MSTLQPSPLPRHPERFYIGGEWVAPSSNSTIRVLNSGTEEHFLTVAEAQAADVNRAVEAARAAFDQGPWPRMAPAERAEYLDAIGAQVDERAGQLARIWTTESGVVHSIAQPNAATLGSVFRNYAKIARSFRFIEEHQPTNGGTVGYLVREPVGVVAAIVPWNGPLRLMTFKAAPALLAGCTMVLKASPEAPAALYVLAEICAKVGLPPGVVNVITADREVSELLVRHPGIDKVSFTGSTAAGRRIASICGERIARCTLELGGKSAALILDDYDLDVAAQSLSRSASYLTGQACSSLTRILVTRRRQGQLLEALAAHFGSLKVGDPFDAATQMGPLATARQRERVEGYISKGKAEGARLVAGGARPSQLTRGFFVQPTVFGDVDNHSTIAREEIFGPVLSVIPVDHEEDAVATANDSIYGLNASVFTNDAQRAYALARRLRSGTVGHNAFRSDFGIAFGGFKQSGIGREGGTEGVMPYLEAKTVILDAVPASLRS